MNTAILDRALKALEQIGSAPERATPTDAPPSPRPAPTSDAIAQFDCGSPHCNGCYDVGDGRKIHPPRIGRDYLDWLKRWQPKGQIQ